MLEKLNRCERSKEPNMICCPRCDHQNPAGSVRCHHCNFTCQLSPVIQSCLEILDASFSYPNSAVDGLRYTFENYLENEDEEPVFEALQVLRENFECVSQARPATLEAMRELPEADSDHLAGSILALQVEWPNFEECLSGED